MTHRGAETRDQAWHGAPIEKTFPEDINNDWR
jgi:hypothetical protein